MTPWLALWLVLNPHFSAECEKECLDRGYFLKTYEMAGFCYCQPFEVNYTEVPPEEYVPFVGGE